MRNGILKDSKCLPTKYLLIMKGKSINLQWRSLADTTLIKWLKCTLPVMGQIKIICHLIGCTQHHCCVIPSINGLLEANYEEMPDEPKLGEVLQNN